MSLRPSNLIWVMPAQGRCLSSRALRRKGTSVQKCSSDDPSLSSWGARRTSSAFLAGVLLLSSAACATGTESDEAVQVRFALDWAPNTNHIGVYVAEELGYFEDAGLEVEILPYASTPVPDLLDAGAAEFGLAGQAGVQVARTAGRDVVSVFQVVQKETGHIIFLGDREDIQRPADLDGLTFGGFGSPMLQALTTTVIQNDGGSGEFTEISLDTGAYEALSSGNIDFTLSVSTWEDIQAEIDGHPYQSFRYQDYGVPELHTAGISASRTYVKNNPEATKAFIAAVRRGYQYAVDDPAAAAQILIDANPATLGNSEELVRRSTEKLAQEGYFVAEGVPLGAAQPEIWEGYGDWLFHHGLLVSSDGQPVTEIPDWAEYYSNEYLGE